MAKRKPTKAAALSPTATVSNCSHSAHSVRPDGVDRCAYCGREVPRDIAALLALADDPHGLKALAAKSAELHRDHEATS
jgi:transposase